MAKRAFYPAGVSVNGALVLSGSGTPEGNVTAPVGSVYLRTDGGAATTAYVKESGTGDTGWTAVGAGGGSGDVTGPGSSTDHAIARWGGTDGDELLDSAPTVEDDGRIANVTDPTGDQDAATKGYVDDEIAAAVIAAGAGDVVGPASSVDGEAALFDSTTGKLLKRATGTGPAKLTSGVLSASNVNLASEVTGDLPLANLTPASAASKLLGRGSAGGAGDFEEITLGTGLSMSGTTLSPSVRTTTLGIVIDGGGAAITTGIKGDLRVPFACTIVKATVLADQSGSIVVDVWKDTYANFPPTDADSITASAPPTLSTAVKSEDATLTGWTTSIAAGDILRFNVDSAATVERVVVQLDVTY